ncbi:MAG: hypothetical protein R3E33_00875 [Rhodocyclaceae bacterium]
MQVASTGFFHVDLEALPMSGSIFGEKDSGLGAYSVPPCFELPRGVGVTLRCSPSIVGSRIRKWPDVPAGMIDLLRHDGDLDVLFED